MSSSNGINVGDVVGLSEPLTKLIEVVSSGIGKVYEPINIRRVAKAKADEIKLISDVLVQNSLLPANYSNGVISIDTTDGEDLLKRAGERLIYQEMLKQQNIDSVIDTAYGELENIDKVSKDPVDKDWIIRFMNSIEDISNEHMQEIWGKLLAGEIKQPNTFSLRTLEKLKNLTQHEAFLFKKVSEIAILGGVNALYKDKELLKRHGLNYSDLLHLEECGLISTKDLAYSVEVKPDSHLGIYNNELVAILSNKMQTSQSFAIPIYKLTASGSQLLKVIHSIPNNDFFISAVKELGREFQNFSIKIHPILKIFEEGDITYENTIDYYNA